MEQHNKPCTFARNHIGALVCRYLVCDERFDQLFRICIYRKAIKGILIPINRS